MSEQNDKVRGIRKLNTFITANALLIVVLLVWAQLWIQPSVQLWVREYGKGNPAGILNVFNLNVGIGLAWTYLAVLLALIALAWVGWRSLTAQICETPSPAIGLFAASLVMAILDVGQSFISVSIKAWRNLQIYEPIELPAFFIWLFVGLAIAIIGFSLWGACRLEKDKYKDASWGRKYLPWVIEGIVVLIAVAFVLGCVLCFGF